MAVDPDRKRWQAEDAARAAQIKSRAFRHWRIHHGLFPWALGQGKRARFSMTDTAVLVGVMTLTRLLKVPPGPAVDLAESWRNALSRTLFTRLNHGVWGLDRVRLTGGPKLTFDNALIYLDDIAEHTIEGLGFPLWVHAEAPRSAELARAVLDVTGKYLASDEWVRKRDAFAAEVAKRGTPADWVEISVKLAVPLWVIALGDENVTRLIVKGRIDTDEALRQDERVPAVCALVQELGKIPLREATL